MTTYSIAVKETTIYTKDIEANSLQEAIEIAREEYYHCGMDASDWWADEMTIYEGGSSGKEVYKGDV